MKKIFLLSVILSVLIIFFAIIFRDNIPTRVKNYVPQVIKDVLKIPIIKKQNYDLKEQLSELEKELERFKRETIIGNEKYLGIKLSTINAKSEKKNKVSIDRYQLVSYPHDFGWWGDFYQGRYIEKFKDQLILVDNFKVFKANFLNINGNLKFSKINSNLEEINNLYAIRDLKVINNDLYIVAFLNEYIDNPDKVENVGTAGFSPRSCKRLVLLKADLNLNDLEFETFFNLPMQDCFTSSGSVFLSGGRIEKFDDKNIILTVGDFGFPKYDESDKKIFQEKYNLGKVLLINLENKSFKHLSMGHRNTQGLVYVDNKNLIITTEHGPRGGDEININYLDKLYNFGWPIASYGIRYNGEEPFKKSHDKFGFDEPFKYFKPSIGPSQIIRKHDNDFEFYLTTLKSERIYKIKFDENFKKIEEEEIFTVGERIRDIVYLDKGYYALMLDSSPSIGIFNSN